jgi:hypothetical protein
VEEVLRHPWDPRAPTPPLDRLKTPGFQQQKW